MGVMKRSGDIKADKKVYKEGKEREMTSECYAEENVILGKKQNTELQRKFSQVRRFGEKSGMREGSQEWLREK